MTMMILAFVLNYAIRSMMMRMMIMILVIMIMLMMKKKEFLLMVVPFGGCWEGGSLAVFVINHIIRSMMMIMKKSFSHGFTIWRLVGAERSNPVSDARLTLLPSAQYTPLSDQIQIQIRGV